MIPIKDAIMSSPEETEAYLRARIDALQRRVKELEAENAKLAWDLHVTLVCNQERQEN